MNRMRGRSEAAIRRADGRASSSHQHVEIAHRLEHLALAGPAFGEVHYRSGLDLDRLARVAAIDRAAGDEVAELVRRQRESPTSRRADPKADLGPAPLTLPQQAPAAAARTL